MIKYSNEKPPVFDMCVEKFGISWDSTIFAYGDTVHAKHPPTEDIMVHEAVHLKQQNGNPMEWWDKYLNDSEFRLNQEIPAYRKQYYFLKGKIDRNTLDKKVRMWCEALSSRFYGNVTDYQTAYKLITK